MGMTNRTDYLLMLAAVLVVVALLIYLVTNPPPPRPERDYITIEGRIVEVKTGDRLVLIWENVDGTFAIRFSYTGEFLPIGENIRLTYFQTKYGSRIIENVELLEGRG